VQSVHWPSSVQAAFHPVDSTTHVPSADGWPTIVFGRISRTPLAPPPTGLLPPPPGVNAVAQPFLLACGCSAPKSRPPPFTTCWGLCLRHDLGTVALVAVYVIMICGRFRSRGRCGNGRANLLILWRVLHGFYWLGHSTSLGDSLSLFAPGWVCVLRLAHVEASTGSGALSCGQDR